MQLDVRLKETGQFYNIHISEINEDKAIGLFKHFQSELMSMEPAEQEASWTLWTPEAT